MSNDPFESLREALNLSPDNVPLRMSLAQLLLERGHFDEAETEYKKGLQLSPSDDRLKFGLAKCFFKRGKDGEALVILEEMIKRRNLSAEGYVLSARLMLRRGDVQTAVAHYKAAIEEDPGVGDDDLAEQLGVTDEPGYQETSEVVEGKLRAGWQAPEETTNVEMEKPSISFADVGGMESLKEEIRLKIIYPLQQRELYEAYGKKIGGGILMYGPPGCGKTYLARATAGEINANFVSVGISDVLDMWIGNSERKLHEIFEQCRRNSPCVLFFDEVDALGARRSDMRQSAGRHLINQFLSEMDGVNSSNDGLLILAATNAPWHLDPAFRRPGRFDRILFVPPPDDAARAGILRLLCRGKPTEDIDFERCAKKMVEFSGADLKGVVDIAIESKLQESMKSGGLKPLSTKDLLDAAKRHRPTTREWFGTARNYALYSNESGLYDEILTYLKK